MKETTIVALVAFVGATILCAMKIITGEQWMWVASIAAGGKALQGAADRFKPNR